MREQLRLDLQPDGNGPIVGQAYLHVGAELAGGYQRVLFPSSGHHVLEKPFADIRGGSGRETGSSAFAGICR